ncbi:MAG: FAD-dependent oxidoreductase [Pseudomonadota bacterium]
MGEQAQSVAVDVAIFGGGVAGLWLLGRLRKAGYHAILLEADRLGAGQTCYAQGIIHGGTKYALTGKLTGSSEAIVEMPARWRACLEGKGELDLSTVKLMSDHQYMWSTTSLTSRLAGFFASKLMRSRTRSLEGEARPELFRDPMFKGQVYRLDEPVLDTASLIETLAAPYRNFIFRADGLKLDPANPTRIELSEGRVIEAQRLVLSAGAGNEALLQRLGREAPKMQRRPLQMVMLRGKALPAGVYAHCLGANALPRITITSHFDAEGNTVWYIGGQPAEEGVGRSREDQISAACDELVALFPWIDFTACEWGTLNIDRAEVKKADGSRPDDIFVDEQDGVITAWPTKLALAPRLADEIESLLTDVEPSGSTETIDWPHAECAVLPWQEEEKWS